MRVHFWSGIKTFSDKDESTIRKTLFIATRLVGLKFFFVFDFEFLDYREIDQKYVFAILATPLVLKEFQKRGKRYKKGLEAKVKVHINFDCDFVH